jgi:hypothetical protein
MAFPARRDQIRADHADIMFAPPLLATTGNLKMLHMNQTRPNNTLAQTLVDALVSTLHHNPPSLLISTPQNSTCTVTAWQGYVSSNRPLDIVSILSLCSFTSSISHLIVSRGGRSHVGGRASNRVS